MVGHSVIDARVKERPRRDRDDHVAGVMGAALLVVCCFPYVSPIPTPFDTQPYAALLAVGILLRLMRGPDWAGLSTSFALLMVVVFAATASWLLQGASFTGARSVFGYVTVLVIGLAAARLSPQISGRPLPWVALVWFIVGAAQQFLSPTFGSQVITRMSTSESRGVTSLAAEPSFYAIVCVFLLLLNDYFQARHSYSNRTYRLTQLLVVGSLALAASALGFLLLLIYLASRAAASGHAVSLIVRTTVVVAAASSILWLYTNVPVLEQSRAGSLISSGTESWDRVLYTDQSVAQRAFAIHASHLSLLYSDGLGYGVGTWREGVPNIIQESDGALYEYGITSVVLDRTMSGFGSSIYELGMIGLLIPIALVLAARASRRVASPGLSRWILSASVAIAFTMEGALPLAFPLFGFTLGLIAGPAFAGAPSSRSPDLVGADGSRSH